MANERISNLTAVVTPLGTDMIPETQAANTAVSSSKITLAQVQTFVNTNPAIIGGTANNIVIGGVTPAAGTFTNANLTTGNITTAPTLANNIANKAYVDSVSGNANPISNIVYVGLNGNDTTGDGSIGKPYLTLTKAIAVITTATDINPFLIQMATGDYSETTINLKPSIYINGNQSNLTITNVVGLDATWLGVAGTCQLSNFNSLITPAGIVLDFNAAGALFSVVKIEDIIVTTSGAWSFTGDPSTSIVIIKNTFNFSVAIDITLTECYGGLFQSTFGNTTLTNCPFFSLFNSTITGNLIAESNSAISASTNLIGTVLFSPITVKTSSTGASIVKQRGCTIYSSVTLDGTVVSYDVDSATGAITYLNGATLASNVTLASKSEFVASDYVPVNYTAIDSTVHGALEGIDNALGAISSGLVWNTVTGTSQSAAVDNGYFTNNAALVTVTLPVTAAFGTTIRVAGQGAGGWLIAQNAGQNIVNDGLSTTVGVTGSLASTDSQDAVELVCRIANTQWQVISSMGLITTI